MLVFNFILIINNSYSQLELVISPGLSPSKKVYINKSKKMSLTGVNLDKLLNQKLNLYYYHSNEGADQNNVYLDNNQIELYYNNKRNPVIIFDQKQKKKAFDTKRCYYSIIIYDSIRKAKIKCLYEEEKMILKQANLVSVFIESRTRLHIGINPPVYLLTNYRIFSRKNINEAKYLVHIETFFPKTFFNLYSLFTDDLISKYFNAAIINLYNELMNNEINNISMLASKKEFETTNQYQTRLKRGQKQKVEIENKYKTEISKFTKIANIRLKNKIKNSLSKTELTVDTIGKYNADYQFFPITINNVTKNVNVQINEAKNFKKDKIVVIGKKQLNDDGVTFHYFNIKIINPVSGDTITF